MTTKITHEELELVAKATGMEIVDWSVFGEIPLIRRNDVVQPWLPHSDPGDSRRLQVALHIDLDFDEGCWYTINDNLNDFCEFESLHPTPDDAACVAVFRCALAVALVGEGS